MIITDPLGLQEATKPGETSVVVPRKNEQAIANAIIDLYDHPEKRYAMGKTGRSFVLKTYELNDCFKKINDYLINPKNTQKA